MNLGVVASAKLAKILSKKYSDTSWMSRTLKKSNDTHVVVAPSFTALIEVARFLQKSNIALCGQDMFWQEKGAYTGQVSPLMLSEVGCDYVILGHSEKRKYAYETYDRVNKKVKTALHYGMIPIVCVGESMEERQTGLSSQILLEQLSEAFDGVVLTNEQLLLIAYEPIWAIGTATPATSQDAEEMHAFIKQVCADIFPQDVVEESVKVLYGGSVVAENAASFTQKPHIDGVLVGGASLKSKEFLAIISEVRKAY